MSIDLELAQACQGTYNTQPSIYNKMTGAYICISRASDGITIIAFRGSVSPQDWFRDFNTSGITTKTDPDIGFCHAGFLDACISVRSEVRKWVRGARFYVTGHSLGGAEAVGTSVLLLRDGLVAEKVVTFGAPRFGGYKFRKTSAPLDMTQYRYAADPVPLVPPLYVFPFGIFLNTRPQTALAGTCPGNDPTSCHHIENYVGALR